MATSVSATQFPPRSLATIHDNWNIGRNAPAVTTQATVTLAALGAGVRYVCRRIIATVCAAAATVIAPVNVNLRDGTTGAGTILASWSLAAVANTGVVVDVDMLELPGTAATAMTLEFAAASAAGSLQTVMIWAYQISL